MRLLTRRSGIGVRGGFLTGEEGRHVKKGTATSQKANQSGNGLRSARLVAGWEPL